MKRILILLILVLSLSSTSSFAENSFFEDIQFYNFKSTTISDQLNHTSSENRAKAVKLLGQTMQPEAFEILLSRNWINEHFHVKSEICFSLGQVGLSKTLFDKFSTQATHALQNLITTQLDETAKLNCMIAVSRLFNTDAFTETLQNSLVMLSDEDLIADYLITLIYHIRAQSIQNPGAVVKPSPTLFDSIKKYASSNVIKVRRNLAFILGRFNTSESKEIILNLLDDSNHEVQLAALNSLKRLGAAGQENLLIGKLSSENFYIQFRALNILAQLKQTNLIPFQIQNFLVENGHFSVAQQIIQSIDLLSNETRKLLDLSIQQSKSVELRAAGLFKIKQLLPQEFQDQLPTFLASSESGILEALAKVGIEDQNLDLLNILIRKLNPRVLAAISESLDKIEAKIDFFESNAIFLLENASNENLNFVLPFLLKISDSKVKIDFLIRFFNKLPSKSAYDYIKEELLNNLRDLHTDNSANKETFVTFLRELLIKEKSDVIYNKTLSTLKDLNVSDLPNFRTVKIQRSPFRMLNFTSNPTVLLNTTKGKIVLELYADIAPTHVANFVGLIQTGYYTNNYWHRVVSDFVIQSGSLGETGYWDENKFELLSEITTLSHERGSIGMARSDRFDSGSNQIFIDHQFTPSLDGLYTTFGKVVQGMNVVDSIERGDKIISAEVID